MTNGRNRTDWMDLKGLKSHFKFHEIQAGLLDTGLERIKTDAPAFIILHTGAALRPDGAEARQQLIEAITDKIAAQEAEAIAAEKRAQAWADIRERIEGMTHDHHWKNPLWEKEILRNLRKDIRSLPNAPHTPVRHGDRLFSHSFRRGFTYRDVIFLQGDRYAAFQVDRTKIDHLFTLKGHWNGLFPEIDFTRKIFKWMVFPKDLSGNAQISYLQYGFMAGPKAGKGHTRRYDLEHGAWREGESVESWVS